MPNKPTANGVKVALKVTEPVKEADVIAVALSKEDGTRVTSLVQLEGTVTQPVTPQQVKAPPVPIWNIVTRGQKGKDMGPGVITHMVDEAGASIFPIFPC